jgi:multidrug resistance efflux pump
MPKKNITIKPVMKENNTNPKNHLNHSDLEDFEDTEIAKPQKSGQNKIGEFFKKNPMILDIIILVVFIGIVGGVIYWNNLNSRVYIEQGTIDTPIISLTSPSPGILEKVNVNVGDYVSKSTVVAVVNGKEIHPATTGIVTAVQNTPGSVVSSQTSIVSMIDPKEMRLLGIIEEDKGLKDIKVGQRVIFTMDAFPGKKYEGFVDSIAPTSRQSDIVFSISNARQEQNFNIKIKFDRDLYPEIKNGMSAKIWVYK